jgi:hypothetical protein
MQADERLEQVYWAQQMSKPGGRGAQCINRHKVLPPTPPVSSDSIVKMGDVNLNDQQRLRRHSCSLKD